MVARNGRVGYDGVVATKTLEAMTREGAESAFNAQFKSKTGNKWEDRSNFLKKDDKYDLILNSQSPLKVASYRAESRPKSISNSKSSLPIPTQELLSMVLDKDMFKSAMSELKLDMNALAKLPLGVLNTEQISKGLDALKQIEQILSVPSKASKKKGKSSSANPGDLNKLTDRFYTVIPHAAKMNVKLPVIDNLVLLQEKYEMLSVLGDIAIGAAIDTSSSIDDKYAELNCKLDILPRSSEEFNVIERYISNTMGTGLNNYTLDNVWSLSRNPEDKSFAAFKKVDNHRLLWHGTKVAMVAGIMKTGLRLMPAFTGSRCGRGIYLANELMKSAGYSGSANNIHGKQTVVLFLVEAALGKQHVIYKDDSSFVEAPPGFDSVLAKSGRSPPESGDATLTLGGTRVKVSQLPPAPVGSVPHSSFCQDEFLVYKEAQQRLRYAVTFTYGDNEDYGDY